MLFRKKRQQDIQFEEILLGSSGEERFMELSLGGSAFRFFYVALVLVAMLFAGRLVYLWQAKGSAYAVRAQANANKVVSMPAGRGIIFDRYGTPLAQNQPIFSVSIKISEYLKNKEEISFFLANVLGLDTDELDQTMQSADTEKSDSVTVARDLEPDLVLKLKAREIKGIEITDDFRRFYPEGAAFAHVLGYSDQEGVGKTGLELFYNSLLTGKNGYILRGRNSKGELLQDDVTEKPKDGQNITLTLDADLQNFFYKRLEDGLRQLGRKSGAGLAIDPRNGEILAAVSFPSFDDNLFTKKGSKEEQAQKAELLTSGDNPLFTRFALGSYNPGSTIKPLVALGALTEGVITPETSVFSPGYIELPNPYDPKHPSRFVDWKPQGWVNLYSAIARSSNVFFYEAGGGFGSIKGLGINRLNEWWSKLGLGKKTGADFPNESDGFLPNPDEKEKRTGTMWRIGDTYNVSIGQGDLLVTPLQLLNYIAAFANGGKIMVPHFNKALVSTVSADFGNLSGYIKEIAQGMEDVASKPYGTAYSLHDLPFKAAAKTGTAQISNNTKTNAFFVGFAPSNDPNLAEKHPMPEIAVLVLVENAKDGSVNTIPVAKDVLNWYYQNRIINTMAGH